MRISVEVLIKAVRSTNMSETPLQEEKLTFAISIQWRGTKLFLDSESEGKAATPKGFAIEKRGKWCCNVYSDGQESKAVLEFVAVGEEPATPLCPVVNGGGNCHSLGGASRYADQREAISITCAYNGQESRTPKQN